MLPTFTSTCINSRKVDGWKITNFRVYGNLKQGFGGIIILDILIHSKFWFIESCPIVSKQNGIPHSKLKFFLEVLLYQALNVALDLVEKP